MSGVVWNVFFSKLLDFKNEMEVKLKDESGKTIEKLLEKSIALTTVLQKSSEGNAESGSNESQAKSPSAENKSGENVQNKITSAVTSAMDAVVGSVKGIVDSVTKKDTQNNIKVVEGQPPASSDAEKPVDATEKLNTAASALQSIVGIVGNVVAEKLEGAVSGIKEKTEEEKNSQGTPTPDNQVSPLSMLNTAVDTTKQLLESSAKKVEDAAGELSAKLDEVKDTVTEKMSSLSTSGAPNSTATTDKVQEATAVVKSAPHTMLSTAIDNAKEVLGSSGKKIEEAIVDLGTKLDQIKQSIAEKLAIHNASQNSPQTPDTSAENIVKAAVDSAKQLLESSSKTMFEAVNELGSKLEQIKENVTEKTNTVSASSAPDNMEPIQKVEEQIKKAAAGVNSALQQMVEGLGFIGTGGAQKEVPPEEASSQKSAVEVSSAVKLATEAGIAEAASKFQDLKQSVAGKADSLVNSVNNEVGKEAQIIKEGAQALKEIAESTGQKVEDSAKDVGKTLENAKNVVMNKLHSVMSLTEDKTESKAEQVQQVVNDAKDKVQENLAQAAETVKSSATDAVDSLKKSVENTVENCQAKTENVAEGVDASVKDAVKNMEEKKESVIGAATEAITALTGK